MTPTTATCVIGVHTGSYGDSAGTESFHSLSKVSCRVCGWTQSSNLSSCVLRAHGTSNMMCVDYYHCHLDCSALEGHMVLKRIISSVGCMDTLLLI